MDNHYSRMLEERTQEVLSIQRAAALQMAAMEIQPNSIGPSMFKALDFTLELDEDDLFPLEDVGLPSNQRSGSKSKGRRGQKSAFGIFDNSRKSLQGQSSEQQKQQL